MLKTWNVSIWASHRSLAGSWQRAGAWRSTYGRRAIIAGNAGRRVSSRRVKSERVARSMRFRPVPAIFKPCRLIVLPGETVNLGSPSCLLLQCLCLSIRPSASCKLTASMHPRSSSTRRLTSSNTYQRCRPSRSRVTPLGTVASDPALVSHERPSAPCLNQRELKTPTD